MSKYTPQQFADWLIGRGYDCASYIQQALDQFERYGHIKPCPCCGREAKVSLSDLKRIECLCGLRTDAFATEKEAVEVWNRRVGE